MTAQTPVAEASAKWQARLRIAGAVALAAGLAAAAAVYFLQTPASDLSDDVASPENSKRAVRDVEANFGGMGLWSNNLVEALKDPGVQAILILGGTALVSGGCFYFAHLWKRHAETDEPPA